MDKNKLGKSFLVQFGNNRSRRRNGGTPQRMGTEWMRVAGQRGHQSDLHQVWQYFGIFLGKVQMYGFPNS